MSNTALKEKADAFQSEEERQYDAWFRTKVEKTLENKRAGKSKSTPHKEVFANLRAKFERMKNANNAS